MKMGTLILPLFLMVIMLFNSLRISITYAFYYLDTQGFIEMFCENTDKPELECNGKCQLQKVAESKITDTENPVVIIDFKEIVLFVEYQKEYLFCVCQKKNKHLYYYNNLYSFSNSSLLEHPPQV